MMFNWYNNKVKMNCFAEKLPINLHSKLSFKKHEFSLNGYTIHVHVHVFQST
jgi:hypothetical protein